MLKTVPDVAGSTLPALTRWQLDAASAGSLFRVLGLGRDLGFSPDCDQLVSAG